MFPLILSALISAAATLDIMTKCRYQFQYEACIDKRSDLHSEK